MDNQFVIKERLVELYDEVFELRDGAIKLSGNNLSIHDATISLTPTEIHELAKELFRKAGLRTLISELSFRDLKQPQKNEQF